MMFLSEEAFKKLELDYIFGRMLLHTPYGESCKREMKPYLPSQKEEWIEELDRIEKMVASIQSDRPLFIELRNWFEHCKDLRGSLKRIEEGVTLSTVELFEMKGFVGLLEKLARTLQKISKAWPEDLQILPIRELVTLFDPQNTGIHTFYIYDEYSEELKRIRQEIKRIEKEIHQEKQQVREEVQKHLGVKIRPNGELSVNKNQEDLIGRIEKCQGLVYSAETYMNITYRLKLSEQVDGWYKILDEEKIREEEEETKVRVFLTKALYGYLDSLYHNIHAIGRLDLLIAKAYLAIGMNGVRPQVTDQEVLRIQEGRHIKVADQLRKQGKSFTPITVELAKGVTCITGANMGGKTVSLKLIGLLSAMAQYGLFVPAEEMIFSLKEYIFLSVGDLQSVDMGLSTFGGEILEIRQILERAGESGLILIDELARGTNPAEGYAISKAILHYLRDGQATAVITTHFDGLTELSDVVHLQVRGLAGVDFEELKEKMSQSGNFGIDLVHQYMDYRLERVEKSRTIPQDAINIARLMGLQEEILSQAEKYLNL